MAWRNQAIISTSVDLSAVRSFGIHLMAIFHMSLKITDLEL